MPHFSACWMSVSRAWSRSRFASPHLPLSAAAVAAFSADSAMSLNMPFASRPAWVVSLNPVWVSFSGFFSASNFAFASSRVFSRSDLASRKSRFAPLSSSNASDRAAAAVAVSLNPLDSCCASGTDFPIASATAAVADATSRLALAAAAAAARLSSTVSPSALTLPMSSSVAVMSVRSPDAMSVPAMAASCSPAE